MKDEIKEKIKAYYIADDIDKIIDYITNLQESEAYYYGQYKDYKSRNEKAIEYIKAVGVRPKEINSFVLLNILQGEDKDE